MNSENTVEKKNLQDIFWFFRSGVIPPMLTYVEDNSTY